MKNIAIVLAGGVGSRVGGDLPKQFIEVLGKPIMVYTLETFEHCKLIDEVVFVCHGSYIDLAKDIFNKYNIKKISQLVSGGEDFLHSCINGIDSIRDTASHDDIVVITSADRPLLTEEEIEDAIAVCKQNDSGIAARPCSLCMFNVEKGKSHSSQYMRETLVQTATPWAFNYQKIRDSLNLYQEGSLPDCETYPVAIYAAAGNEVYFSRANPVNVKITEKSDILLLEAILRSKQGDGKHEQRVI